MKFNPETGIDGYKIGHRQQFVPGLELAFGNLTPRKSYRQSTPEGVVWFGLQYFLKEYLIKQWNENFFQKPREEVTKRFTRRINNYLGPNNVGVEHIGELHDLGYLPLSFWALPEGSVVPYKVAPLVYFTTDKRFGWVQAYIETIMSTSVWPLSTAATTAKQIRDYLEKFAKETVGNTDFVKFQGHNFSYRGCVGHEAAIMIDAGFITSFAGSDTVPGGDFMEEYYNADSDKELISCSVNATEHAVMCSYGPENEEEAFRRLIEDVYPTGILSIVSDTLDYWNVITNFTVKLKDKILARDGKVVFRPDSGDNVKIIVGENVTDLSNNQYVKSLEDAKRRISDVLRDQVNDETPHGEPGDSEAEAYFKYDGKTYLIAVEIYWNRHDKQYYYMDGVDVKSCEEVELTCEQKGTIESLWDIFGGTVNEFGYKELNPKVGAILGDGVNGEVMKKINEGLKGKGFASTNMVYGIGSYYLVYGVSRDTDGWAVKSTYCEVEGFGPRNIFKNPKTDLGNLKKSAKGLIAVYKDENGGFYQKDEMQWDDVFNCEYEHVFENGKLLRDHTLTEIRNRLHSTF